MRTNSSTKRMAWIGAALACSAAFGADWVAFTPFPTNGAPRTWACGVRHPDGRIFAVAGTPWVGGAEDGAVHYLAANGSSWITAAALDGPKISQAAGIDSHSRIIVYGGKDPANGDVGASRPYDPVEGFTGDISERSESWPAAYFAWASDDQSRLYSFGGNDGEGGANSTHAHRYDASLDAWQVIAPMNVAVSDAAATFDGDGHILVIGGINAGKTARTGNVARYDIATNTWSDVALPDLPVPTSGHRVVLGSDNRVYVLGGEVGAISSGATTAAVWALNLNEPSPTWSAGPAMATPRKHFGAVLDTTNTRLLVMGGENDAGGTNLCETLFTPICPEITAQSTDVLAWRGTLALFWASASGAGPLSYEWRRDGVLLTDGPPGSGSSVSGATTAALSILNPDEDDIASYTVTVSNACGSVASDSMSLSIRTPPSTTNWRVSVLHPAWIQNSSYATGIDAGRIVGYGMTPVTLPDERVFTLARPLLWPDEYSPAQDLTPPGSVGGTIYDIRDNVMTGWFWHTWSCWGGNQYWTCAWQSAGYWDATTLGFTERHASGAEYDSLYGTDGYDMAASVTHEYSEGNYTTTAHVYDTDGHGMPLHPSGYAHSQASAVDSGFEYGGVYNFSTGWRAARGSGSAASFASIHPAGYQSSSVSGARDGQVAGSASMGGVMHAGIWASGGGAFLDLTPNASSGSGCSATHQGVQVGNVGGHAALWLGTPDSLIDLDGVLPSGYSGSVAYDVEVGPDLTITVVGVAYNTGSGRYEAMVWRSFSTCPADINADGFVNGDDYDAFAEAFDGADSAADFNDDGFVNGDDYDAFAEHFELGC